MRRGLFGTTAISTLALMASLAVGPRPAVAGSISPGTYTFTNTGGLDWNPTSGDVAVANSSVLNIPTFNNSNGDHLTSVIIVEKLTSRITGQVSMASGTLTGTAFINSNVHLVSPPSVAPATGTSARILKIPAAASYFSSTTAGGKHPAGSGGGPLTTTPRLFDSTMLTATGHITVTSANLAGWETNGRGSLRLTVLSSETATDSLGFGLNFTSPNVTETLAITPTYNFSGPVPEPGTVLLLGSGIIALGGARRRKKRASRS